MTPSGGSLSGFRDICSISLTRGSRGKDGHQSPRKDENFTCCCFIHFVDVCRWFSCCRCRPASLQRPSTPRCDGVIARRAAYAVQLQSATPAESTLQAIPQNETSQRIKRKPIYIVMKTYSSKSLTRLPQTLAGSALPVWSRLKEVGKYRVLSRRLSMSSGV